jgi:hypothetical protein
VKSLVNRFFGSPGALAVNLLRTESLTPGEIAEIEALIAREKAR